MKRIIGFIVLTLVFGVVCSAQDTTSKDLDKCNLQNILKRFPNPLPPFGSTKDLNTQWHQIEECVCGKEMVRLEESLVVCVKREEKPNPLVKLEEKPFREVQKLKVIREKPCDGVREERKNHND